jgi:hypothetical protein
MQIEYLKYCIASNALFYFMFNFNLYDLCYGSVLKINYGVYAKWYIGDI